MAKDRSKEILAEVRQLRREVAELLNRLESQQGSVAKRPASVTAVELSSPDDSKAAGRNPQAGAKPGPVGKIPGAVGAPASAVAAQAPFTVIVKPVADLSMVRTIEGSLRDLDGVLSASLRELSAESAVIDTVIEGDFPLIKSLRQELPIAFDVVASDQHSCTIALAQPQDPTTTDTGHRILE